MPGLRVGWVAGPSPVIDKIVQAKQAADLHTSSLAQALVLELVTDGFLNVHVPRLCQEYCARRDTMLAALQAHMPPGVTWTRPEGGMFLMGRLPEAWDGGEVLGRALARKVAFVPGAEFHLNGAGRNTIRLNFTYANPPLIEEGIKRLAAVLMEHATG
jgi:DNA-binding transcriptional MocR family regulator